MLSSLFSLLNLLNSLKLCFKIYLVVIETILNVPCIFLQFFHHYTIRRQKIIFLFNNRFLFHMNILSLLPFVFLAYSRNTVLEESIKKIFYSSLTWSNDRVFLSPLKRWESLVGCFSKLRTVSLKLLCFNSLIILIVIMF